MTAFLESSTLRVVGSLSVLLIATIVFLVTARRRRSELYVWSLANVAIFGNLALGILGAIHGFDPNPIIKNSLFFVALLCFLLAGTELLGGISRNKGYLASAMAILMMIALLALAGLDVNFRIVLASLAVSLFCARAWFDLRRLAREARVRDGPGIFSFWRFWESSGRTV